jgi:hypothetical protein
MKDYYEQVAEEIENKEINKGIWARAMSESDGDRNKAESLYIKYRVKELKSGGRTSSGRTFGSKFLIGVLQVFFGVVVAFSFLGFLLTAFGGDGGQALFLAIVFVVSAYSYKKAERNPLIFLIVAFALVGVSVSRQNFRNESQIERSLIATSNEINANLPIVLDEYTRLDSTSVGDGRRFTYEYTILGVEASSMDFKVFEDSIRQELVDDYRNNEEMRELRVRNVEVTYNYRTESGEEIASITISPDSFNEE